VLLLGEGDLELETSLSIGIEGPVDRSATGLDVDAESYHLVALSREASTDRRRRRGMLRAAARAVTARGMVIAEFPNLMGRAARPLLMFEGLASLPVVTRGGTTFGGARRLVRGAGLRRMSGFLCLPSLADPRIVLPLDSPPALSYHFREPFFIETRRRRLMRRALELGAKAGLLGTVSPGFTLFATREAVR
jgi:hypothetical protein